MKGISKVKVHEFETIMEEIGNATKDMKGQKSFVHVNVYGWIYLYTCISVSICM